MRLLRLVISTQCVGAAPRARPRRTRYGSRYGRGTGTCGTVVHHLRRENIKGAFYNAYKYEQPRRQACCCLTRKCSPVLRSCNAPRVPPFMYSYHLRERSRGGRKSTHGRPKAVTWPATAVSTSRSVTDRQLHRHTHSCEARVEASRQAAPSPALEALRRGGPCPVEEDRRQGGLGGADESPPN